ncbi:MAG TPA: hypothetical protein VM308_02350 [Sphingomicrobium sp.]|nr:hypothetical protein [Sphingomicrobium sp.]
MIGLRAFLLAAGFALAACTAKSAHVPPPSAPPSACPVMWSSEWAAWVNAMPGPAARRTLIVTGKVTVPTGGYRIDWADMRVAKSHPVQIFAELRATPPAGPATDAITTHEVRGEWPMDPPVGSVTIACGGRTLARIAPVETAY